VHSLIDAYVQALVKIIMLGSRNAWCAKSHTSQLLTLAKPGFLSNFDAALR